MSLVIKIGADLTDFERKMKRATKEIRAVGTRLSDIGKEMTMKLTLPLLGVAAASTKVGMDFEAAMSEVAAISGATGNELEALTNKARNMGATTKFSASQSAEAMKYMAMAGWNTTQVLQGLEGVMNLAAASGEELATVSDIVTDALTAFGMKASESSKFADLLANVSTKANTNVSMLGESFKYVAPVAGSLGYSAEDVARALGLMANSGIKASQAGTSLRGAIARMTDPAGEAAELMHKLGLRLTDSTGNMLPFSNVMDQLRQRFGRLSEEQKAQYASTIFGQEAMSGMLAIINASTEDYQKLIKATSEYDGASKTVAETMEDNRKGRWTKFISTLQEAALAIDKVLAPTINALIALMQGLVNWFNNLDGTTKAIIVAIGAFVAAIGPLLLLIGTGIMLFGQLSFAASTLGISIGAIVAPVAIAVAAIIGLITIGTLLYKHWDKIKEFFLNIWKAIVEGVVNRVNEMISNIEMSLNVAITLINGFVDKINSVITAVNKIPGMDFNMVSKLESMSMTRLEVGDNNLPKIARESRKADITVELDGRTIARAIGQPLMDEIRVKTGLRI